MSKAIIPFEFEGQIVRLYVFRGRVCCIAPEAGRALAYSEVGFRSCMRNWQGRLELKPGEHYDVLSGADLEEFRALLGASADLALAAKASSVTILYEEGLNMVCLLTNRPLGQQLRQKLAADVLPKIARGEGIPATKAAPAASPLPPQAMTPELVVYFEAKARLERALAKGEITEAYFDSKLAEHLVRAGGLDYTVAPKRLGFEPFVGAMTGLAANQTVELKQDGKVIARAHGLVDPGECVTASEVARRFAAGDLRSNPAQVNEIARALGIFGDEEGGWGRFYETSLNLTTASSAASKNWLHSPKALERLGPYVTDVARGGQRRLLELVREINPARADELEAQRRGANERRRQTNAARKAEGAGS